MNPTKKNYSFAEITLKKEIVHIRINVSSHMVPTSWGLMIRITIFIKPRNVQLFSEKDFVTMETDVIFCIRQQWSLVKNKRDKKLKILVVSWKKSKINQDLWNSTDNIIDK
jgi:hypothetical protein